MKQYNHKHTKFYSGSVLNSAPTSTPQVNLFENFNYNPLKIIVWLFLQAHSLTQLIFLSSSIKILHIIILYEAYNQSSWFLWRHQLKSYSFPSFFLQKTCHKKSRGIYKNLKLKIIKLLFKCLKKSKRLSSLIVWLLPWMLERIDDGLILLLRDDWMKLMFSSSLVE